MLPRSISDRCIRPLGSCALLALPLAFAAWTVAGAQSMPIAPDTAS